MSAEKRIAGRITHLRPDKGFGFIAKESGESLFFHASSVQGGRFEDLSLGDEVTFLLAETAKGPRAVLVKREEVGE